MGSLVFGHLGTWVFGEGVLNSFMGFLVFCVSVSKGNQRTNPLWYLLVHMCTDKVYKPGPQEPIFLQNLK